MNQQEFLLVVQLLPPSVDSNNEPILSNELLSVAINTRLDVRAPIPVMLRFVGIGLCVVHCAVAVVMNVSINKQLLTNNLKCNSKEFFKNSEMVGTIFILIFLSPD